MLRCILKKKFFLNCFFLNFAYCELLHNLTSLGLKKVLGWNHLKCELLFLYESQAKDWVPLVQSITNHCI